jgi:hypothetical protein
MTLKEQLFQELDNASDDIVAQILKDLRSLKSKTPATDSLTSLIGQAQGTFANPEEADRFIRQERDTWDS